MQECNSKNELIGYLIDEFEENDDITLLVDFEVAKIFNNLYEDKDFSNYYSVNLQSDVNEYFVVKISDVHFSIEPARYENKYLESEGEKLIVLYELLNEEVISHSDFDEIEVVNIIEDVDNDSCSCCQECCGCHCDNEEDAIAYEKQSELINEYYSLMKDNEFTEEAVKLALTEFGKKVLGEFSLMDSEEE